jgi:hypothetical protein
MSTSSRLLGTWKVTQVEVTSQTPIALPREAISVFTQRQDGIQYVADVIYSDGQRRRIQSTFRLDGQMYGIAGGVHGDTWSIRETGPNSFEAVVMRKGRVSAKASSRISSDYKLMTTDWELIQPEGPTVTYTTLAERQA